MTRGSRPSASTAKTAPTFQLTRYCPTFSASSARNGRRPIKTVSRDALYKWDGSAIEAQDQCAHGAIAGWPRYQLGPGKMTGTSNPLILDPCPTGPTGPSIFL